MINKPYIYRYRHVLEQALSNSKTVTGALENENASLEESAPQKTSEIPSAPAENQLNNKGEIINESPGSSSIPGFEQVAPGIFQFSKPSYEKKEYKMPPELLSLYPQQGQAQTFRTGEMGYKRVDGLPGPFQNYRTPVYQFT